MTGLIYTAHQPDLFPYSGFWYKMAKADVFELKIFDQFQMKPGYQRRVKMHDQWVGVTARANSSYSPICDWRIDPTTEPEKLVKGITKTYERTPHWDKYGPMICDRVLKTRTPLLWQFNVEMAILMREILGITTPLSISVPHVARGAAGIVESISAYKGVDRYLSGTGARAYMGDCRDFTDVGIQVIWSNHKPITGDSVLTVLMEHDDPLAIVMAENDDKENA